MFTVEIAGIPIGIDNRYEAVVRRCRGWETAAAPLFTVSASEEEMIRESGSPCPAAEVMCVYRNIALKMMEYDAFVMHAAVVDVDGQGVAFAAKSGTGKTTRLLLWQQTLGSRVRPVNGDKPILRFTEDNGGGSHGSGDSEDETTPEESSTPEEETEPEETEPEETEPEETVPEETEPEETEPGDGLDPWEGEEDD